MDEKTVLDYAVAMFPSIRLGLEMLGALVVFGTSIVILSPTKKDDAKLAKLEKIPVLGGLIKAVKAFSPIQQKKN